MKPRYFATQAKFRDWLEMNHAKAPELWVGFHKVHTGKSSITWPQSVDEALCFGWIDGIKKRVDEASYTHRFTPRTANSVWSAINLKRIGELLESGCVTPAGRDAFERRDPKKAQSYSFENRPSALDPALERTFRANAKAWAFFHAQPPGYRKIATFWIMSAMKDETRLRRLGALIKDSAERRRLTWM